MKGLNYPFMANVEPNLEQNIDYGYDQDERKKYGGDNGLKYLIVDPQKGGIWNLFKFLVFHNTTSGIRFLDSSDEEEKRGAIADHRLVILTSIIVRRILALIAKPLAYIGFMVDFFLNLLSENDDFIGLLVNFLHGMQFGFLLSLISFSKNVCRGAAST